MRLQRLLISRFPGVETPLELDESVLDRRVVVITGPNGSGKTTICRAVRSLLWPELAPDRTLVQVHGRWMDDGQELESTVDSQGGTRWWRAGVETEPPSRPGAHLADCFTLGVLDLVKPDASPSDERLAAQIRRQMAGGFDLDEVARACFEFGERAGLVEKRDLDDAWRNLAAVRREQRALAAEEDELASREAAYERACEARRQADVLARQIALVETRAQRQARAAAIETEFPDGMDRLLGNEAEQLAGMDRRIEESGRERDEALAAVERLGRERERCGLDDAPPGSEELAAARERVRCAQDASQSLQAALRTLEAARARRDAAREALGAVVDPASAPPVTPETLGAWDRLSVESERVERDLAAIDSELRQLGDDRPDPDAERARTRAEELLQGWLREEAGGLTPAWPAVLLSLLGLGLAGCGAWIAQLGQRWGWLVAGAAVVLLLAAWSGVWAARAARRKRAAERVREYAGLAVDPPAEWTTKGVVARLDELRRERAEDARRRDLDARRTALLARRAPLEHEGRRLREQARALLERHGLDLEPGGARASWCLRNLAAWHDARIAHAEAEADVAMAEQDVAGALGAVGELVCRFGAATPRDAAEAHAALEDLAGRARRADEAAHAIGQAQATISRCQRAQDSERQARARLLEGAGLAADQDDELRRRIGLLGAYREASETLRRLLDEEQRLLAELGPDADPGDDASLDELRTLREEAGRLAADEQDLFRALIETRQRIEQARAGHALQDALAAVRQARETLEQRREDLAVRAAGQVLLGRVGARHEIEHRPAVMRHASDLLGRFTGYRYEIEVSSSDDAASLRAKDTSTGQLLNLTQLSDGTRSQLWLATRLAFADSVEGAHTLPLLLDEVLVASDPERFDAIASSLARLAADEGRQVIFLTAEPYDAARVIQRVRETGLDPGEPVDLAALRAGHAAARAPLPAVAARPVPDLPPESGDVEAWARALGVGRPDPWRPLSGWHPLHVLADDPLEVHALLSAGFETVGQWQAYRRLRPGDGGPLGAEAARGFDAAIAATEAIVEGWREGRGRPLTADVIAASEAVSENFHEKVVEKLEEVGGDARALVEALRNREVTGFRQKKLEELERELEAEGYLDPRAVLTREQLAARARTRLEARGLPDPGFDAITARVDRLLSWLPPTGYAEGRAGIA